MTLELDNDTLKTLEALAHSWGLSKEQALRRALDSAQASAMTRLEAFDALQKNLKLDAIKAEAWLATIRDVRR
jgi:hypothetical protein